MKHFALPILFLCCLVSCKSKRQSADTSFRIETQQSQDKLKESDLRIKTKLLDSKRANTNTLISEDILLLTYDPQSGNLKTVQKTNRSSQQVAQSTRSTGGSSESINREKEQTAIKSRSNETVKEHRTSKTDTRLVQASEWFWLLVGTAVAVVIVVLSLIYFLKRRG